MGYVSVPQQGGPNYWSVTATAAVATQVVASKSAGAATVAHVAKRCQATFSSANAATTVQAIILLDGTTVIAQWAMTVQASTAGSANPLQMLDVDNLWLVGTVATLMSLNTAAINSAVAGATGATVNAALNLIGFDLP